MHACFIRSQLVRLTVLAGALVASGIVPVSTAPAPGHGLVSSLTSLPSLFGGDSHAYGINEDGVVVGWTRIYGQTHACRWSRPEGLVTLGEGAARRINASGVIVGYAPFDAVIPHATVWVADQPTTIAYGEATDVNDGGQVVGFNVPPSGVYTAFLWSGPNSFEDLGTLLGHGYFAGFSQAMGITDDGLVVGWSTSAAGRPHAITWTAADGMHDLGAPSGLLSFASDANRHHVIVGGVGTTFDDAAPVLWDRNGKREYLQTLGGRTQALAINDFDQVAGWSETGTGERHAVVWHRGGGLIDLGPGEAQDINSAGQVAGWRTSASGQHAAVWQLAPAARGHAAGLDR